MKNVSQEFMQILISYNPKLIGNETREEQENGMILITANYESPLTTTSPDGVKLKLGEVIRGSWLSFPEPDFDDIQE